MKIIQKQLKAISETMTKSEKKTSEVSLKTIEIRLDGIKNSLVRMRFTFIVMLIASISILIAVWNSYLSWDRDFAFKVTSHQLLRTDNISDINGFLIRIKTKATAEERYVHDKVLSDDTRASFDQYDNSALEINSLLFKRVLSELNAFIQNDTSLRYSQTIPFFENYDFGFVKQLSSINDCILPKKLRDNYLFHDQEGKMEIKRQFLENTYSLSSPVTEATPTVPNTFEGKFLALSSDNTRLIQRLANSDENRQLLSPKEDGFNYNRKLLLSEWVKNSVVSVGLLGIRVATNDLAVIGGVALSIITIWFFFNVRRENREIWSLFRDLHYSKNLDWEIKYMAYQVVEQSMIFLETGKNDQPKNDILDKPFWYRNPFPEEFILKNINNFKKLNRKICFDEKNVIRKQLKILASNENNEKESPEVTIQVNEKAKQYLENLKDPKLKNDQRNAILIEIINFVAEKSELYKEDFKEHIPSKLKDQVEKIKNNKSSVDKSVVKRLNCFLLDLEHEEIGNHGKQETFVRLLVTVLFYLPPITILSVVVVDILSLFVFQSAFRGGVDMLWNSVAQNGFSVSLVKLIAFESIGISCFILTAYLCWKYNKYFNADAKCLHDFRKELNYQDDQMKKLFN
jgi:hypothetical protein